MAHTSVLLKETIDGLDIQAGDVFVDGTLGDGGHSAEVLKRLGANVTVVGIDRDQDSIDRVETKFKESLQTMGADASKVFLKQGNFRNVETILQSVGLERAERFLFDIGMSSRQIEEANRGFSFRKDEPLLMTFEKANQSSGEGSSNHSGVTARVVVNEWAEENLETIIAGFGEEKFARRIAKGIVQARLVKPIETTTELVDIIKKSTPIFYHFGKIHPATRTFQAIRIAVNDELGAITDGIKAAWKLLTPGGRIAVISFHSLEDRIVKQYFNELKSRGSAGSAEGTAQGAKVITKRPITASEEEIQSNPRSRSAKLRIIEKIKN